MTEARVYDLFASESIIAGSGVAESAALAPLQGMNSEGSTSDNLPMSKQKGVGAIKRPFCPVSIRVCGY